MKATAVTSLVLLFGVTACTSVPTPSPEFLANNPTLSAADGVRGKRLSAPTPNPPIAQNEPLMLAQVEIKLPPLKAARWTPMKKRF